MKYGQLPDFSETGELIEIIDNCKALYTNK